ncbi:MAG: hypothetical protein QW589_01275 [Candidatus Bathyarchaeia archaeon]
MNALVKVLDEVDYFPEANEWIERAACKLVGIDYTMYADEKKREEYFNRNPRAELEFIEKDDTVCIAYNRLMGGLPYSNELPKVFVSRSDRKVPKWAKVAIKALLHGLGVGAWVLPCRIT